MKVHLLVLAAASFVSHSQAASFFADEIVQYEAGVGFSARFTHPQVALGEASRVNPFGELTDQFNPPYGTNQIVSIGAGGSLTVRFHTPILNHPNNIAGLDFTIFGNTGFIITNEFDLTTFNWIGTPATDGTLFAESTGETRVWVSDDGVVFYLLNPALAPRVDSFPPSDGAGSFHVPIPAELGSDDFAGATLEGIRTLYGGSGGGASYDISWAQDSGGHPVVLKTIRYVRVEVWSGKTEVDAIAAVARTPGEGGARD